MKISTIRPQSMPALRSNLGQLRRSANNIAVPKNEIQTSKFSANYIRPTQAKNE